MTEKQHNAREGIQLELNGPWISPTRMTYWIRLFVSERMKEQQQNG